MAGQDSIHPANVLPGGISVLEDYGTSCFARRSRHQGSEFLHCRLQHIEAGFKFSGSSRAG